VLKKPRARVVELKLTEKLKAVLVGISSMKTGELRYHQRSSIILRAANGEPNLYISKNMKIVRGAVKMWIARWRESQKELDNLEEESNPKKYLDGVLKILSDKDRPGAPAKFTAEEVCGIIALACEKPDESKNYVSHWSCQLLAEEATKRGIVKSISRSQVDRFLKYSRS